MRELIVHASLLVKVGRELVVTSCPTYNGIGKFVILPGHEMVPRKLGVPCVCRTAACCSCAHIAAGRPTHSTIRCVDGHPGLCRQRRRHKQRRCDLWGHIVSPPTNRHRDPRGTMNEVTEVSPGLARCRGVASECVVKLSFHADATTNTAHTTHAQPDQRAPRARVSYRTNMVSFQLAVVVLVAFAASAVAYDNGAQHSRLPPLGWSSWVALGPGAHHPIFDFCDEESVKAAADAFVDVGLYDAGYRHFHLDDCWAGGRNESGFLYAEKDHFPNGMKPVIDYVHSKGLTMGLYTCAGTHTCVGGRPGSKDHWKQDSEYFASVGADVVKMDWCNTEGMDPKSTYPLMSSALNTTGRPIHFNLCEWGKENPWEWADKIAQSWRATGDHTPVWESTKSIIQSSAKIPAEYTGRPYGWNDLDMLETGNYGQAAHANGKEGTMTATEYATEFSMWAISASPLVVTTPIMNCSVKPAPSGTCNVSLAQQTSHASCKLGQSYGCFANGSMWTNDGCRGSFECNGYPVDCDVDGDGQHLCGCGPVECVATITDLQKQILFNKEVIAINQDVTPQGRPIKDGDLTVWARHLSDKSVAVALYNEDDTATQIGFSLADIGLTKASVRDLWAHTDNGTVTGTFPPTTVQPHQAVMLRLTPTA
eukprot:m.481035 g.481035  ORF g.481035 m.481035 type:complete len:650 (-) comp22029_c0_seq1:150-2099(-)